MCAVSFVGDHYRDKWAPLPGTIWPYQSGTGFSTGSTQVYPAPASKEDVDALRKEVLEMKELLKRAKKYDEDNGEPNCEMDDKMAYLRKVAGSVGVEIDDVLRPHTVPPIQQVSDGPYLFGPRS